MIKTVFGCSLRLKKNVNSFTAGHRIFTFHFSEKGGCVMIKTVFGCSLRLKTTGKGEEK